MAEYGFRINEENFLLVTYQQDKLLFFEIDSNNEIGSGGESRIHQGKNLETAEFVALKESDYIFPPNYHGKKIAQQEFNPYPRFVKSHVVGKI